MKVFIILTLKEIFWKTKTFFRKLEYCFLLENTTIENATFPYKAALSKTNVKTNRMGSMSQESQIIKLKPEVDEEKIYICFKLKQFYLSLNVEDVLI